MCVNISLVILTVHETPPDKSDDAAFLNENGGSENMFYKAAREQVLLNKLPKKVLYKKNIALSNIVYLVHVH